MAKKEELKDDKILGSGEEANTGAQTPSNDEEGKAPNTGNGIAIKGAPKAQANSTTKNNDKSIIVNNAGFSSVKALEINSVNKGRKKPVDSIKVSIQEIVGKIHALTGTTHKIVFQTDMKFIEEIAKNNQNQEVVVRYLNALTAGRKFGFGVLADGTVKEPVLAVMHLPSDQYKSDVKGDFDPSAFITDIKNVNRNKIKNTLKAVIPTDMGGEPALISADDRTSDNILVYLDLSKIFMNMIREAGDTFGKADDSYGVIISIEGTKLDENTLVSIIKIENKLSKAIGLIK